MGIQVNHRCSHARPRQQAPHAPGAKLAMRVSPDVATTWHLAFGGFAFGGTGPQAVT